ncbi:MAG TPA: Wzz/FepE/Etk N-terminal domain-containing protein [Eggerthellaceae bacterium]|nr:Wzz/FepE/Etk N-terminal domain-containing protein [Eggerthellaceae bacterium]
MTLLELFQLLKNHLKLVIALPIIFALVTAVGSWIFLANTYTANVSMYVLANSSETQSNASLSTDLSASQMITNDVSELIQSERVLNQAANQLGMSESELKGYDIEVTSSTTTRLITISVTGDTPNSAAAIANGIADTTNSVAQEIMNIEAVNVIDQAEVPTSPSGPPRTMYTAVAFLAGIFVAVAIVVLMDMINTRIRKPEEIEELLDIPVIGRIPVIK